MKRHKLRWWRFAGFLASSLGLLGAGMSAQAEDFLREQGGHGFALEPGQVLLPRQQAGAFSTLHRANIEIPDTGRYRFHLETLGAEAELTLRSSQGELSVSQASSDWLELEWGELELELRFEARGTGRRQLRVLWEREFSKDGGFLPEPLPWDAWLPVNGLSRIDGIPDRLLLEAKGCTNCHLPTEASLQAVGQRPGPNLAHVGSRLREEWMRRWITDPAAMQPGADMPSLFGPDEGADVDALVDYLASLLDPEFDARSTGAVASEASVLDQGRELYHAIGCVACHGALEPMAQVFGDPTLPSQLPASPSPAPFGELRHKWIPSALSAFLQDPGEVHADGRMPSMELGASEADLLSNYLLSMWGAGAFLPPASDRRPARRGKQLFQSKGCAACHSLEGVEPLTYKPLAELRGQGGCLDAAHPSAPSYDLDDQARTALERGALAANAASGAEAPLDQARRDLERLNCYACHSMNGQGGPAEDLKPFFQVADERVDLGDEGRLAPDLSGAGWKLTSSWLDALLVQGERARPFLRLRMPSYGAEHVGALPHALAQLEGVWPNSDLESPQVHDDQVAVGREMMGREALSCVTCHSYKDMDPLGSPGTSIDQFGERLRYEWARSFLRAPQRFKPGSRMPDFYSGGKSTLHSVYDGDLGRQVDAMWAYFGLGEFMPPPPGMQPGRSLRVLVEERPVVMRAFLEGSGSRAIAVGTPEGTHYAFDAERVCLSEVWAGDFLDASGSWAGRGGSTLGGRGSLLWQAPEGVPLQLFGRSSGRGNRMPPPGGAEGGLRFRGYRLDAAGYPSFLYDIRGSRVEERVEISMLPSPSVKRSFRITGKDVTGVTLNAMPERKPKLRARVDGGAWMTPSALPLWEGRAYFHQVVPEGFSLLEIEMELQP